MYGETANGNPFRTVHIFISLSLENVYNTVSSLSDHHTKSVDRWKVDRYLNMHESQHLGGYVWLQFNRAISQGIGCKCLIYIAGQENLWLIFFLLKLTLKKEVNDLNVKPNDTDVFSHLLRMAGMISPGHKYFLGSRPLDQLFYVDVECLLYVVPYSQ